MFLKISQKFIRRHLRWSLFLYKAGGLRPSTLSKKSLLEVFSCEFCEMFKNTCSHRLPVVAASETNSTIRVMQGFWRDIWNIYLLKSSGLVVRKFIYHQFQAILKTIYFLILATLLVAVLFACVIVGHSVITEATYKRCISDANQKFATLTENIYKSDSFFGTINNLKCRYVSRWFVLILKVNFVNDFLLKRRRERDLLKGVLAPIYVLFVCQELSSWVNLYVRHGFAIAHKQDVDSKKLSTVRKIHCVATFYWHYNKWFSITYICGSFAETKISESSFLEIIKLVSREL